MLAAMSRFQRQHGRWPTQRDLRSDQTLPGYATLWRRFGGIDAAVEIVDAKVNEKGSSG
jgi:hypothetical protein